MVKSSTNWLLLEWSFVCRETEEPVTETEKIVESDKQEDAADANKENTVEVAEEKEPEEKVNFFFTSFWMLSLGAFALQTR